MAVATKKTFAATANATTSVFTPVGIELNNQDDLDVYVTLADGSRVLQYRRSGTGSTTDSNHPQVSDTTDSYFPSVNTGVALYNYSLSSDNNTITFTENLPQGAVVYCERRTRDTSGTYTTFAGGGTIRASELNKAVDEVKFTAQEARNKAFLLEKQLDHANISVGFGASLEFEGSTINDFETTLAAADPTADRTITLPNQSGNVLVSGNASIVDADVSASAELNVTKLAQSGTDRQVIQTNGTNVEWTSNIDLPGTLDVSGAATLDDTLAVTGASTFTGPITGNGGATVDNIQIGITGNNEIDTSSGNLTIDSAGGATTLDDAVTVSGTLTTNGITNATGSITGDLVGNVTGNVVGDVTGDLTGNADTCTLATDMAAAAKVTDGEHTGHTPSNTSYFTTLATDARYFRQDSSETITSGDSWNANSDTHVATTKAIDARIIDLVDDVGGFVPIASETAFPATNPDINNPATGGTIVSIKEIGTSRTPTNGVVQILNGSGSNTITINNCGTTVLSAGFGALVETTATLHTYNFHRLSPKTTEVTTCAGISSDITTVAGISTNVTTVANNTTNVNTVATDITNVNTVATDIANVNTVANATYKAKVETVADDLNEGTSEIDTVATNITNVNNVGTDITNVNTCATNLASINYFGDRYQVTSGPPSTRADGTALEDGDLIWDTNANELKVYDLGNTSWTSGVTTTGNFALVTGNTFTGTNIYNDGAKAHFGTTADGLEVFHDGADSYVTDSGTGDLNITSTGSNVNIKTNTNEVAVKCVNDGAVELWHGMAGSAAAKKLETSTTGATVTGNLTATTGFTGDLTGDVTGDVTGNVTGDVTGNISGTTGTFTGDVIFDNGTNTDKDLTWDASADSLKFKDNVKAVFGTDSDLQIYHDGSNPIMDSSTGNFYVRNTDAQFIFQAKMDENSLILKPDGAVEAYHDGNKKFETNTYGIKVYDSITYDGTGTVDHKIDDQKTVHGTGDDLQIYHNALHSYIDQTGVGQLYIRGNGGTGEGIQIQAKATEDSIKCISDGAVELYYDNAKKLETTSSGVHLSGTNHQIQGDFWFNNDTNGGNDLKWDESADSLIFYDSVKAAFGVDSDLLIFHNGTDSYLKNSTGKLILEAKDGEDAITINPDGAVELYYDNAKKFETTSGGTKATGTLVISSGNLEIDDDMALFIGTDDDASIYHEANGDTFFNNSEGHIVIQNTGTNDDSNIYIKAKDGEHSIVCSDDAQVELYYDGVKTVETNANGIEVFGPEGGAAIIRLSADERDDDADKWRIQAGTGGDWTLENYNTGSWEAEVTVTNAGNLTALGNVTAYSDSRLKTDVKTIENAVDTVSKLRGVSFTRLDTQEKGIGVIAQEIEEVIPEVVQDGAYKSVAYGNVVGVLIEAIKELKAEIEELKGGK